MPTSLLLRPLRVVLPLLACLLLAGAAQAQPEPIKFGLIDSKDLTTKPLSADSAAAVVLCDFGRSHLKGKNNGFQVIFERVTRIKILTRAGYDQATIKIPLYHRGENQERVTNLRGFTYNLVNGAVEKTKLEASGAFFEKRTANVNVQKFTLPNVRAGAVIEFAYTLSSDFLFNFQDWTFQRDIPVRWSEYRVSIPSFYRYKIIYQSSRDFTVNEAHIGSTTLLVDRKLNNSYGMLAGQSTGSLTISAPTEERQWALKDVPALVPEPYMTTAQDYVARLDFELTGEQWPDQPYHDLTGTWAQIDERLLADEDFGGRLGRTSLLKEQLRDVAARFPIVTERAAAVREAVMAAVRYNGTDRYWALDPPRKAFDAHRGTSADVNLLLIAALRDAGLPAHPLLLSTRDHGHVSKEFPLLERFNYVVALVPLAGGKDLLVDATEPLLPCGVLPERCLNQAGRLIMKNPAEGRWVDLSPTQRHVHYQQIALTLDTQGGLTGKVHEERGGYAGTDARLDLASQGEKKYLAGLAQRHEGWTIPASKLGQVDALDKPLLLDYDVAQPATGSDAPGSTLYLSPLSDFGPRQNPFRRPNRTFAVDFGVAQEEILMITLTLPAGYELAEVPASALVTLPNEGGRFVYSVSVAGPGRVQLTSRLSLRNTVYPPDAYASLRELYRLLMARQSEKLIIQKRAG